MTPESYRVLEALEWSERRGAQRTRVREIAEAALGGDAALADRVLSDLRRDGCLAQGTPWPLSPVGRRAVLLHS